MRTTASTPLPALTTATREEVLRWYFLDLHPRTGEKIAAEWPHERLREVIDWQATPAGHGDAGVWKLLAWIWTAAAR